MTTKITVEIKGADSLLDAVKSVQADERNKYEERKEEEKEEAKLAAAEEVEAAQGDQDGAIKEEDKRKKRPVNPKLKRCGHWIYKDFVTGRSGDSWDQWARARLNGEDVMQYSVGSGDGTQWATHYINAPSGRIFSSTVTTGSMNFIGYLSYVQYYEPGSGFGTVYTLPEGAIETPYDPMVYLQSTSSNWGLYFPDELGSGPNKYRRMITLQKRRPSGSGPEFNQAQVCFPVNNKKSVIIVRTWLSWTATSRGEQYYAPPPSAGYFLHPQNTSNASVKFTVYYKNPGADTGWTPINGFYWLMDPGDEENILSVSELNAIFPLSSSYSFAHNHKVDVTGFVVSYNRVKKLENIPSELLSKMELRYPEAPWDTYFPTLNRYYFYYVIDKCPGYPPQLDEDYNTASWEFNPDSQCMGVARNLFQDSTYDSGFLPYDHWIRDPEFPGRLDESDSSWTTFETHRVLGISPGAYDYYDSELQDYDFFNHYGYGGYAASAPYSLTSNYGEVRLHTKDVLKNDNPTIFKNAWYWFYKIREKVLQAGVNRDNLTKNDIAWIYLTKDQREAYIDNYKVSPTDSGAIVQHALQAPEDPEFNYMFIERSEANDILTDGVRWISEGGSGSWTSAYEPPFDSNSDPYYDPPYMDPADSRWKKSRYKHKLSRNRQWPPSISAGISEPIPATASAAARADHPLAKGTGYMTLVINTAWDKDYSQVLLGMGFTAEDLAL